MALNGSSPIGRLESNMHKLVERAAPPAACRFQGLSGMIIMCNAVVIGLETDLESKIWFWVELLGRSLLQRKLHIFCKCMSRLQQEFLTVVLLI